MAPPTLESVLGSGHETLVDERMTHLHGSTKKGASNLIFGGTSI